MGEVSVVMLITLSIITFIVEIWRYPYAVYIALVVSLFLWINLFFKLT